MQFSIHHHIIPLGSCNKEVLPVSIMSIHITAMTVTVETAGPNVTMTGHSSYKGIKM